MKENSKRRDYANYIWQWEELLFVLGKSCGVVCLLAFFFYRSIWAIIPLSGVGWLYFRLLKRKKCDAYREKLILEFRECMLSVSTLLKAGYAVENAFLESKEDMKLLYGENSAIYQELELIRRGLVINITLEEQLLDLAERSHSEEIMQFVQVFSIAKRNGGNMAEIMESAANLIGKRIDTEQEIQTMLSGKRMEQNVMKLMPFIVLIYVGGTNRGYFDVLYHNLQGVLVMTGCLVMYLFAFCWGERIIEKISDEL